MLPVSSIQTSLNLFTQGMQRCKGEVAGLSRFGVV